MKKISINIFFIITFTSLFLLDRDRVDPNNLLILNYILSFFTLISIIIIPISFISFSENKLKITEVILLIVMLFGFIGAIITRNYVNVHWIYLISFYLILKMDLKYLNRTVFNVLVIISVISVIYQLLTSNTVGRYTLTYIDPNYSSMVIYFLAVFVYKNVSKKLAFFVFFLGLLTLSRNYILAVMLFYLYGYLCRYKLIDRSISLLFKPAILIMVLLIIPLSANYYVINKSKTMDVVVNTTETKLSGSLIDSSNLHRSKANILFLDDLVSRIDEYAFGVDSKSYIDNIFINTPHHALFQMILNYGYIFSIPYFILFFNLCYKKCVNNIVNRRFYLGLCSYYMILGGGINGMFIYLIAFIFIDKGTE
ncbi:TPA: hypothetical protein ACX6Q1_003702 [Photobacterium damselae]